MTKDQMILDLVFKTRLLFWSSIVLGSLSIGILGYSVTRYVFFPSSFILFSRQTVLRYTGLYILIGKAMRS